MAPKDGERPYKKTRLFYSLEETITIIAGKEGDQRHFAVHKKILCEATPFFKAHCKPEWMNNEDKFIKLPEDNADVIEVLIFWIYHNQICFEEDVEDDKIISTCEEALESAWGLLAQLYLTAQKYQMTRLQNDTIDALLNLSTGWHLPAAILSWVYENTTKGDNLRKVIFRIARKDFTRSDLAHFCDNLCQQFLFDIAYAATQNDSGGSLEDNKSLASIQDPKTKFYAEYQCHNFGYGDKECTEIKPYIETLDHK